MTEQLSILMGSSFGFGALAFLVVGVALGFAAADAFRSRENTTGVLALVLSLACGFSAVLGVVAAVDILGGGVA